jgi:hypothetical protein
MKPAFIGLIGAAAVAGASSAMTQTARDIRGPAPLVPLTSEEPPAKIVIDPPLADSLTHGRVVIQYRAENLRIVPVFGPNALDVSPRIGHIHVTVDDAPWRWADANGVAGGGAGLRYFTVPAVNLMEGGVPIVVEGKIVGGIGVSGGRFQR